LLSFALPSFSAPNIFSAPKSISKSTDPTEKSKESCVIIHPSFSSALQN
jgi:hypothetical protein